MPPQIYGSLSAATLRFTEDCKEIKLDEDIRITLDFGPFSFVLGNLHKEKRLSELGSGMQPNAVDVPAASKPDFIPADFAWSPEAA